MRIRTKLLLSTFLPLGIAAAIGIFVLFSVHNLNKMAKKDMIIGRTLKEISQLNIVTNDYLLHYTKRAQRQWQLQQDTLTRLLAKVELKGQKAQIVLDSIRRDNEAAKALFDQLTTNYENRAHLNKEQIGVSLELEKRLAGQLMARSQAMASNTSRLGQIAQAGMLNTRKMATMLVLASVVILAAVIGTTAFFTTKTVVKPISRLHKGAEVVGAGNLDYRVGTTAGDEIGQLSRAFDSMSQQLKVTVVLRDELAEEVARRTVEVRKAHDELDEKVVERTAELAEANVRLKELDRLKSMFIASMGHELRTPLNSIIGFTGVVLQGMVGELNARQKDHLNRAYRSSKHLLSLINDVIDISRVEAGKIEVSIAEFTLDDVVKEAVESVQHKIKEKGLTLEVSIPPGVRLKTDRERLLQCILNYLSNAVKFTEAGTVSIAAREIDGEVEISVSDTGIGIAKEDQPKLFNAFVRLDSALRTRTLGTGLGLYLTGKLTTEVLGGTVAAQSQLGKGSTFTLRLPKERRRKKA